MIANHRYKEVPSPPVGRVFSYYRSHTLSQTARYHVATPLTLPLIHFVILLHTSDNSVSVSQGVVGGAILAFSPSIIKVSYTTFADNEAFGEVCCVISCSFGKSTAL